MVNGCLLCKRFRVRAGDAPAAPLSNDRLSSTNAFEVVGVDFAGPLYVRSPGGDESKCYIALFTCASSRALHLELVSSITAEDFLLSFRRFVARRGLPRVVYSDNARTFKKASVDVKRVCRLLSDQEVAKHLSNAGITWKFIVPNAPWWGGWWERLVRTVKQALRKVLGRAKLGFEELATVLTEIEAVVNSRPLTFVESDIGEPCALTPADLLIGRRLTHVPTKSDSGNATTTCSRTDAVRRYRYRERLTEHFWARWRREYLLQLRSAHFAKKKAATEVKEGDVVLVHQEKTLRQMWKLARVQEVYKSTDGVIRSCKIKVQDGLVTTRPIQRLYPLEIRA